LELHHGDLASVGFPSETFDAVTLSHVIEHVPDPLALLREVRRILKPTGRLALTTPNNASLGHQLFAAKWFGLDPPRHLHIFSPPSLEKLARSAGFSSPRSISTAANADVFIGASHSIGAASGPAMTHHPAPSLLRTLRAISWQYREFFELRRRPGCGEECVLTCNGA